MTKHNHPSNAFYDLVGKMELPDLEKLIIGLAENMSCNAQKMDICLGSRKFLLDKQFECSPENVARFGEMMLLLKAETDKIFNATKTLYRQLHKQWQEGGINGFSGFEIETSLRIEFNGDESVLELEDNTDSKYVKMAEILDLYYGANWGGNLVDNSFDYEQSIELKQLDDDFFIENFGCHYGEFQDDWAEEWFKRDFPQLALFPFPYAAHQMLSHANYALQDVVRIKSFYSEIKLTYQL
ncbi:MAG: hypothetical protein RSC68_27740 [Acinetobacter sp.]